MPAQLAGLAVSPEPLVFQLTACNTAGQCSQTTTTITQIVDTIAVTLAELRTDKGELRIQGSVGIEIRNRVSFYDGDNKDPNDPDVQYYDPLKHIGDILVDPLTGTFDFRVKEGIDLILIDIKTDRGGIVTAEVVPK
jgi:hypothetical protein